MKTYGLIGKSLGHSFSKTYFDKKFEALGITDSNYLNFELASINELGKLIESTPQLTGLNVTIPYKELVIPLLDVLSEDARAIGAVNCIQIKRENSKAKLIGHNTDWSGFMESLNSVIDSSKQYKALILGTGGASKAIAYTLSKLDIPYQFVSRYSSNLNYQGVTDKTIANHNLIVNTTPLGTFPDTLFCPDIPYQAIGTHHIAFDLVYNPEKSMFLHKSEQQGARIKNGYEMLKLQAEKSWEIWR